MRLFAAASFLVVAAFVSLVPTIAVADGPGAVGGVAFDKADPRAGDTLVVQIAVAPTDGVWAAGSYAGHVQLRSVDGAVLAESADVAGGSATAAGQIVSLFVPIAIPQNASGPLVVRATVAHGGGVVGDDARSSIVVGAVQQGQVAAPDATAAPTAPAGSGAPPPRERQKKFTADINTTSNYAATQAQQAGITIGAKFNDDRSFTSTFGLSTQLGEQKPLLGYQTKDSLTQVGTFSPTYDSGVLSGPSGTGFTYKRPFDGNVVQIAFLSGQHDTPNPFTIAALNATRNLGFGLVSVTVGEVYVTGDATPNAAYFLREGTFVGLQYTRPPNSANFGYSFRYGLIDYQDDVIGRHRADRVLEETTTFTLLRIGFTFDAVRAGPYFPSLTAPGITPDRESISLGGTVPVGKVNLTAGINEYRAGLNGSPLTQNTHFWTESLGADYTLHDGDTLGVKVSNAIQHQDGSQIAYNGNDNTGVTYNLRRGLYGVQLSLGSANQRSSTGTLSHTIQDGVTVTRTVGTGLSVNAGYNTTDALANQATGVSFLDALSAGFGYTTGPATYSASINKSLTRPGSGIAAPPSLAVNYGVALKPFPKVPYSLSVTAAQAHGGSASTTGALNIARSL